jgi:hypothetical protein
VTTPPRQPVMDRRENTDVERSERPWERCQEMIEEPSA